jgi:hypothetical protein
LITDNQVTIYLYTFGGTKVFFVGSFDPGRSPHGKNLLFTPWDKSLKSFIISGKE